MTVFVLWLVWALWPVFALGGGLALAPLNALAAILLAPGVLRSGALRLAPYMLVIAAFLAFAAVSTAWSARAFQFIDIDLAAGDINLRNEVLRVGLGLLASAIVIAAIVRMDPLRTGPVVIAGLWALIAQVVVVGLLALFQREALALFAPMMSAEAEGVQNITRNALIMAAASPVLFFGLWARGRGYEVVALVLLAIQAASLWKLGADAGVLAIAAAICAGLLMKMFPRFGFRVLACGVAAVILTMPLLAGYLGNGMTEASAAAASSLDWRLLIWNRVLEEIHASPFIGNGLGVLRTIDTLIQEGPLAGNMLVPNHAHNMALQLWAETGLVGAVLLSLAILAAGWRLPEPRSLGRRAFVVAGLATTGAVIGFVSFDLWNEWWWSAMGLLAALSVAVCRTPDAGLRPKTRDAAGKGGRIVAMPGPGPAPANPGAQRDQSPL